MHMFNHSWVKSKYIIECLLYVLHVYWLSYFFSSICQFVSSYCSSAYTKVVQFPRLLPIKTKLPLISLLNWSKLANTQYLAAMQI